MNASELRKKFIEFFKAKGHKQIPPASLVPPDDPTTLFTSSGMQQLVPYIKGEIHPMGKRLVDFQPSFRAEDIEEVGDNRHTTFFEMLGNWSLGDYFKKEQLPWFWEFLTKVVRLDKEKLFVTVFEGNKEIPKDEESIKIWQELFNTKEPPQSGKNGFNPKIKIYTYDATKNWWSRSGTPDKMPVGEIGGPDSEIFYDFGSELKIHENSRFKNQKCHLNCDCGRFLEIGNSVFIEYEKQVDGSFKSLPNKNVDFGGGLERILAAKNNDSDIFRIDLFRPVIDKISQQAKYNYGTDKEKDRYIRIIADHLRAAVMLINEGVMPSNKRQGYILRRLIRRSVYCRQQLFQTIGNVEFSSLTEAFKNSYPALAKNWDMIVRVLDGEYSRFDSALQRGKKKLTAAIERNESITGKLVFDLYQTEGFPFELTIDVLKGYGKSISDKDKKTFEEEFKKHQELSRTTSVGMFKGGLADHSETITKLHTATHLLNAALRKILGDHVQQVGSNITSERLRFDFTHPKPLTPEELKAVENLVNEQIKKNLKVTMKIMSLEEAQKQGALAFFGQKYPESVKVYSINNPSPPAGGSGQVFSREVCGGPHMDFTGKLGEFTIKKEESCGAGKRRIYACLSGSRLC